MFRLQAAQKYAQMSLSSVLISVSLPVSLSTAVSDCVYMQYRKCLVECSEVSIWSRGHVGLLPSNENSSAPFLCLSVRPALLPQSMCPPNHTSLPNHPACQGSASGG